VTLADSTVIFQKERKRVEGYMQKENSPRNQASHYFQIRGRSDFSFRELTGKSGRQQREVERLLGEVNWDLLLFEILFRDPSKVTQNLVNSFFYS
jgi:hypothetical protein